MILHPCFKAVSSGLATRGQKPQQSFYEMQIIGLILAGWVFLKIIYPRIVSYLSGQKSLQAIFYSKDRLGSVLAASLLVWKVHS